MIQHLILWTKIIRIVWLTVIRITHFIWGLKDKSYHIMSFWLPSWKQASWFIRPHSDQSPVRIKSMNYMYFKVGFKLFWVTLWLAQKSGTADGRPIFPLFSGRFRPGFFWVLLESVLYSPMLILFHWIWLNTTHWISTCPTNMHWL